MFVKTKIWIRIIRKNMWIMKESEPNADLKEKSYPVLKCPTGISIMLKTMKMKIMKNK